MRVGDRAAGRARARSNPRHDSRIRARPCSSVSVRASPSASDVSVMSRIIADLYSPPGGPHDPATKDRSRLPAGRRRRRGGRPLRDPVRPDGARARPRAGHAGLRLRAVLARARGGGARRRARVRPLRVAASPQRPAERRARLAGVDLGGLGGPRRSPLGDRPRGVRAPRPAVSSTRPTAALPSPAAPPSCPGCGRASSATSTGSPATWRRSPGFTPTSWGWRSRTTSATPAPGST